MIEKSLGENVDVAAGVFGVGDASGRGFGRSGCRLRVLGFICNISVFIDMSHEFVVHIDVFAAIRAWYVSACMLFNLVGAVSPFIAEEKFFPVVPVDRN